VGDEPLLLAAAAPTWVARDRVAGVRAAAASGAEIILMDDGFQNPSIAKDMTLLVIDGAYGFGNGRVIPAGPLRESVAAALRRADAVVLMGDDEKGVLQHLGGARTLRARLAPLGGSGLRGASVVAFAGIGRPAKFFRSLEEIGAVIVARHGFPDHHPYGERELARLSADAAKQGARLITTAKDAMRLSPAWRTRVSVLPVGVVWRDEAVLEALLAPFLATARKDG
jgi:tetraacyldisaccharide 4'-kinase